MDYSIHPVEPDSNPLAAGSRPVLSLFSGAGGLDQGFIQAGFKPVLAIDKNRAAVATYARNHPSAKTLCMDLATTDPATILDLWDDKAGGAGPVGIIGGPPCQAFSSSNVHQSENDPRGKLLDNYARIIASFTERYAIHFFVIENVPGLFHNKHRPYLTNSRRQLEDQISRLRARCWMREHLVCHNIARGLLRRGEQKPLPGHGLRLSDGSCDPPPPVESAIKDLPEPALCAKGLAKEDIPYHPNHVAMVPRSSRFTDGSLTAGNSRGLSFKVLSWNAPSYTVAYGHNEVHVHPNCHRRLSVYEAMLLQGFPHSYELKGTFTEQVRLISDAVPPPLAKGIASTLAQALGYSCTHL